MIRHEEEMARVSAEAHAVYAELLDPRDAGSRNAAELRDAVACRDDAALHRAVSEADRLVNFHSVSMALWEAMRQALLAKDLAAVEEAAEAIRVNAGREFRRRSAGERGGAASGDS